MEKLSEGIIGLVGVLIGAALNWVNQWWLDRRERSLRANYLAIRVVCILDRFVEDCLKVVMDDGYRDGRPAGEDYTAEAQVIAPSAPAFPDDLDWHSISQSLMYRLLSIERDIEIADRSIAGAAEHDMPPDYCEYFEERQYQYAKLGLATSAMTAEIRKKYSIDLLDENEWSATSRIKHELNRIEKLRKEQREKNRNAPPLPDALLAPTA